MNILKIKIEQVAWFSILQNDLMAKKLFQASFDYTWNGVLTSIHDTTPIYDLVAHCETTNSELCVTNSESLHYLTPDDLIRTTNFLKVRSFFNLQKTDFINLENGSGLLVQPNCVFYNQQIANNSNASSVELCMCLSSNWCECFNLNYGIYMYQNFSSFSFVNQYTPSCFTSTQKLNIQMREDIIRVDNIVLFSFQYNDSASIGQINSFVISALEPIYSISFKWLQLPIAGFLLKGITFILFLFLGIFGLLDYKFREIQDCVFGL